MDVVTPDQNCDGRFGEENLRDPDDTGVELYWDRPKKTWPQCPDGSLRMFTNPLDLHDLLAELDRQPV